MISAKRFVEALAERPVIFDFLRWVLEAGYLGEKGVIRREGLLKEGCQVLDLGCGTGALTRMFQPSSYTGVDLSSIYIRHAMKTKPGYSFAVMDAKDLHFDAGSFDSVMISGVIHHLNDDDSRRLLLEAKRVLKPKTGRLVLWEDIPTRSRWNLVGRLVHALDEGDHIRPAEVYLRLVQSVFGNEKHYFMSSGVCDYIVVKAESS